jgi:hypothetical protein
MPALLLASPDSGDDNNGGTDSKCGNNIKDSGNGGSDIDSGGNDNSKDTSGSRY